MTADNFIQRAAHGIWNFMRTPKFEYEIQSKKKNKHFLQSKAAYKAPPIQIFQK